MKLAPAHMEVFYRKRIIYIYIERETDIDREGALFLWFAYDHTEAKAMVVLTPLTLTPTRILRQWLQRLGWQRRRRRRP